MARIDVNKHYKDALGKQYDVHMTNNTQGSQSKVLDGLCKFIDQTAVNGPGIVWTGWLEVTPGNFLYWVDPASPLCAHLSAQASAQHPGNFLAFTQAANQITITHFGTLDWDKTWKLSKVKDARKKAQGSAKDVEKERKRLEEEKTSLEKDPLKGKKKKKSRTRLSGWRATKADEALTNGDNGKFVDPPKKLSLKDAAKVGKDVAKVAAKEGTKAALKSSTKQKSGLGLSEGKARLEKGDKIGAGLEVASGAAAMVPGVGTGVSIGIDALLVGKDVYDGYKHTKKEEKEQELANMTPEDIAKKNAASMIRVLGDKINEYKTAQAACTHCVQGCDKLIELGKKA